MNKKSLGRPSVSVSIASSTAVAGNAGQKILVIGEVGAGATVPLDIPVLVPFDGQSILGITSALALALQHKTIDSGVEIWALPVAEGTAQATAIIDITQTATRGGLVTFSTLGVDVTITVLTTDSLTDIATKLETELLNVNFFTTVRAGATLTLTTVQNTASYNTANVFMSDKFGTAIGATFTAWNGGASTAISPTLLQDSNISERFNGIVVDGVLGTDGVVDYTEDAFNIKNSIKDGVVFTCQNSTYANAIIDANSLNKKTFVKFYNLEEMEFNEKPLSIALEFAFKRGRRLTLNEPIADLVIDGVEALGGMNKASLPYFNTPMNINAGSSTEISESDLEALIEAGGTTLIYNGSVVTTEIVTTYKTNLAGSIDLAWKYLNYVDTMSQIREFFVNRIRGAYGQTRMTDGDLIAGLSITNTGSLKAFILSLYSLLATDGSRDQIGLTRGGDDNINAFIGSLLIEQDIATGRYTFSCVTPIVTQVRAIDGILIESVI